MSSIFSDGALHPGRDANDSAWLVLRRPEDWAGARLTGVVVDPVRPALVLEPAPVGDVPDGELVAGDGTRYRADRDGDQVLVRRPCDPAWSRLVGATGTATGKLRRPRGLALDERRGLLAIADTANHRVQVVRADRGEPVVILGGHGLDEPVALAFGGRRLVVADRAGGRVHVYDDRFAWRGAFAPVPPRVPRGFAPAPIAIAIAGRAIWVIDAGWSLPIAYTLDGDAILDAGEPPPSLADLAVYTRTAPRGEVLIGPIDGRTEELAWHRVIVDAQVPSGAAISVETFASDDPAAPAAIPWAPARPVQIPIAGVEPADGEVTRPVLPDQGRWLRKRGEPYLRAARPLGRLAGTGPINLAGFSAPWSIARRLRASDEIELRTPGGATARRPIASISSRTVRGAVRGTGLVTYAGPACRLVLLERAGAPPAGGPRLLWTFGAGDSLDLIGAADDGAVHDLPATHAVAALVRDGDLLRIDDGAATSATIVVHGVDAADAAVVLAAVVPGDFSISDLRIVTAFARLVVDALDWADDVPGGEPIDVHDDAAGTVVAATLRWAERDTATLWLEPGPPVPWATWNRFTLVEPVATDRGRYLWLRLCLYGALGQPGDASALAGPVVRAVRLLMPRPSFLRYLPAVYARRDADDPTGALFLERFLALPEARLTGVEAAFEAVARELNPLAASPDWLRFVAAWYGLAFDPSWPIARRRQLVLAAPELFARRGTVEGIRRYIEIYLGTTPAIVEGFQWRVVPPPMLGGEPVLGTVALGAPASGDTSSAHHFSIWVFGDGGVCGAEVIGKAVRAILESIKPAHTTYDLHVVDDNPRVGISTTLGVDMVLVGGALYPPLGGASPPAVIGQLTLPARHPAPELAPIPLDGDFTLT